jgi:hypothetical protein
MNTPITLNMILGVCTTLAVFWLIKRLFVLLCQSIEFSTRDFREEQTARREYHRQRKQRLADEKMLQEYNKQFRS